MYINVLKQGVGWVNLALSQFLASLSIDGAYKALDIKIEED